jgi:ferrous iron transport protein B
MQIPVLIALNMSDMAESLGIEIDVDILSKGLGDSPVIRMAAARGEGIEALKEAILLHMNKSSAERTLDPIV